MQRGTMVRRLQTLFFPKYKSRSLNTSFATLEVLKKNQNYQEPFKFEVNKDE